MVNLTLNDYMVHGSNISNYLWFINQHNNYQYTMMILHPQIST